MSEQVSVDVSVNVSMGVCESASVSVDVSAKRTSCIWFLLPAWVKTALREPIRDEA